MKQLKTLLTKFKIHDRRNLTLQLFVVFLGVTAGFLLNNWRISQQEQKLEEKYISAFLQDIDYNQAQLKKAINADSIWLRRVKPVILSLQKKTITIDSAAEVMPLITQISRLELRTGTYEEITNSGNFNIIDDFQLKGQIVDFHLEVKEIKFVDDYFYKFFNDMVMPFIFSEFSVVHGVFKNDEIIHSMEFGNVVAGYFSMVQQRNKAYKSLDSSCQSLKTSLLEKSPVN
jgi:hypothetical protein